MSMTEQDKLERMQQAVERARERSRWFDMAWGIVQESGQALTPEQVWEEAKRQGKDVDLKPADDADAVQRIAVELGVENAAPEDRAVRVVSIRNPAYKGKRR